MITPCLGTTACGSASMAAYRIVGSWLVIFVGAGEIGWAAAGWGAATAPVPPTGACLEVPNLSVSVLRGRILP